MIPFPSFPLPFQPLPFLELVVIEIANVQGYTDLDSTLAVSERETCSLLVGLLLFSSLVQASVPDH